MEQLTRDEDYFSFLDAGKGAPPILLIHDLGLDHTSLRPQFEHFRRRHRVVAVDLLGHGQSGPLPKAYTLAYFAEDLAWLCYELGVYRPVAVGHRIGGAIAVELATRCPDMLAAVVALDAPILPDAHVQDIKVPVLFLGTAPSTNAGKLREMRPGIVLESLYLGRLDQHKAAQRVHAKIDTFLAEM